MKIHDIANPLTKILLKLFCHVLCCDLGKLLKLSQTLKKLVSVMVSLRRTGIRFTLETVKLLGKFRNKLPLDPIWGGRTFDTEPDHNCIGF